MRKLFFLMACALLLTACVSEEGAKKHAGRQATDGLQWSATIYASQREGAKTETIGEFNSLDECMEMARKHLEEKGYDDGAYSCNA